jgi:hypothetical protein
MKTKVIVGKPTTSKTTVTLNCVKNNAGVYQESSPSADNDVFIVSFGSTTVLYVDSANNEVEPMDFSVWSETEFVKVNVPLTITAENTEE